MKRTTSSGNIINRAWDRLKPFLLLLVYRNWWTIRKNRIILGKNVRITGRIQVMNDRKHLYWGLLGAEFALSEGKSPWLQYALRFSPEKWRQHNACFSSLPRSPDKKAHPVTFQPCNILHSRKVTRWAFLKRISLFFSYKAYPITARFLQ